MKDFDLLAILLKPEFGRMLLHGIEVTLQIAAGSWLLAMAIALVLLVVRLTRQPIAERAVAAYVSYHRNVPTLVQLMLWYFGISSLLPDAVQDWLSEHNAEAICCPSSRWACARRPTSARTCAPGLRAIPAGQAEAARALGHGYIGSMRHVMLPQAVRNAVPALVNHSVSLFKNSSLAMAIGVAELTHAVKEIEKPELPHLRGLPARHRAVPGVLAADHGRRRLAGAGAIASPGRGEPMISIFEILRDNWLLLLVGQYPNGPLGGIVCTLILSVLGIVLAFPLSVLLALARLSPWRLLRWPATALVYIARGVPLLMVILWVYFLVPLLIGRERARASRPCCARWSSTRAPSCREVVRARHPGAAARGRWRRRARSATATSARCVYVILPQALYNMLPSMLSQFVSTIKETTLGYVINVPGADLRGQPDQQPAADQALPGVLHPGDHLLRRLLEPDPAGATGWSAASRASGSARPCVRTAPQLPPAVATHPCRPRSGPQTHEQPCTRHRREDDPMILFNNVNKWYGDYQALTDINAEVKKGEVVVVCGPSGSGKSTLIRTVNRLEEIKSGQLLFDGQDIHAPMSSVRAQPAAQPHRLRVPELQPVPAPLGARQRHAVADAGAAA